MGGVSFGKDGGEFGFGEAGTDIEVAGEKVGYVMCGDGFIYWVGAEIGGEYKLWFGCGFVFSFEQGK